jgi:hypothetical protein
VAADSDQIPAMVGVIEVEKGSRRASEKREGRWCARIARGGALFKGSRGTEAERSRSSTTTSLQRLRDVGECVVMFLVSR